MKKRKRIALFGGSFNPPHEGHREIVRRVARRRSIDEVWVLPVYKHPFKKKLPPFKERVQACKSFFLHPSIKARVKTDESRAGASGYTIDLILYLKKKFPTHKFSWIMGGDTYRERGKWKDFRRLKQEVRLIVFSRGKKSPIPNISSTKMRASRKI